MIGGVMVIFGGIMQTKIIPSVITGSIKKIYFEVKLGTENGKIIKSNDFKNMFISTVTMKPMNLLY